MRRHDDGVAEPGLSFEPRDRFVRAWVPRSVVNLVKK
jgi:hypothetical protein